MLIVSELEIAVAQRLLRLVSASNHLIRQFMPCLDCKARQLIPQFQCLIICLLQWCNSFLIIQEENISFSSTKVFRKAKRSHAQHSIWRQIDLAIAAQCIHLVIVSMWRSLRQIDLAIATQRIYVALRSASRFGASGN